jgi:hypothetical protein
MDGRGQVLIFAAGARMLMTAAIRVALRKD